MAMSREQIIDLALNEAARRHSNFSDYEIIATPQGSTWRVIVQYLDDRKNSALEFTIDALGQFLTKRY